MRYQIRSVDQMLMLYILPPSQAATTIPFFTSISTQNTPAVSVTPSPCTAVRHTTPHLEALKQPTNPSLAACVERELLLQLVCSIVAQ